MKALVTGAAGFIGSHLVDLLVENDFEVVSFVLEEDDLVWLEGKGTRIVFGDCTDKQSLYSAVDGDLDYIFHLAAVLNAPTTAIYDRINYEGTKNIVDICLENGVGLKRYVHASSLAASGPSGKHQVLNESSPCRPVTDYGRSKLKAEEYINRYSEELPSSILRFGLVYGPRNRHGIYSLYRVASRGVQPVVRNGKATVVYVKDAAKGMFLAARCDEALGKTYCVGEERIYSYKEVAAAAAEAVGGRVVAVPVSMSLLFGAGFILQAISKMTRTQPLLDLRRMADLKHRYWMYDTSTVARELGYTTQYELVEGTRETVEWYRREGWID